jgi:hypothetical protein
MADNPGETGNPRHFLIYAPVLKEQIRADQFIWYDGPTN